MAVSCEMLLHPELLTNEQLIGVIQERYLRVTNMEKMARDELLELFHHYCVPYGQRKYRDSGRGKLLNFTRHITADSTPQLDVLSSCMRRKISNKNLERIKPPPDLLSGHMKRIKLENNVTIKDFNCKRKMDVDLVAPSTENSPPRKERKLITWP